MAPKTEKMLGREFKKIHPKLRMFCKAQDPVNSVRSEYASGLCLSDRYARHLEPTALRIPAKHKKKNLKTPKMKSVSKSVSVNVFVSKYQTDAQMESVDVIDETSSRRRFGIEAGTIELDAIAAAAEHPAVSFIELGEPLKRPDAIVTNETPRAPSTTLRNIAGRDTGGKDVLIGIIDVGGFDFTHPDFLAADGTTRWVSIWDQAGELRDEPEQFMYGSEITQKHMNAAIAAAPAIGVPAWALEKQSTMDLESHGTHVASIAAGNRGVCRNAFIAGVLIDLPTEIARERRRSFYDSTRVAHAVTYLCELAEKLRAENNLDELPVSINISLGTNGGAHDATNGASRWIDNELVTPGRCVCVAAGNSGQEAPEEQGDFGYIMGRIHTSGRIAARGLNSDIEWFVVGDGVTDISENELEIWYSGSDRFSVTITPPGLPPIGPIDPQEYIQNLMLSDNSMLSVYNELYHPANGANYISIYLSPFLEQQAVIGVRPGLWKIRLHGIEVRDGRYNGWIERDDPRELGVIGTEQLWNFPSFFTTASNVDRSSVSSLACGERVVSVANLDADKERINISSSQGPTRDGRNKPDVAAPGTDIVAANGFADDSQELWVGMTGTSMASPFVAGVAGLMLEAAPRLTSAQIAGIIQRTSQPLPGADFEWSNDAGYGQLVADACIAEAKRLSIRTKLNS